MLAAVSRYITYTISGIAAARSSVRSAPTVVNRPVRALHVNWDSYYCRRPFLNWRSDNFSVFMAGECQNVPIVRCFPFHAADPVWNTKDECLSCKIDDLGSLSWHGCHISPDRIWNPPWVPGLLSPEVKSPGREADHSPTSTVYPKNDWSYNFILPIRLLRKHRDFTVNYDCSQYVR